MPPEPDNKEQSPPSPDARPPVSRRKWLILPAVVLIAFLVLGLNAGWFSFRHQTPGSPSGETRSNTEPEIIALTALADRIEPGSPCPISCEAQDADGDMLAYTWSASDGSIVGAGADVTWLAPDAEGLYRVFVTVDDGRDGAAEASLTLRVRSNLPPEIIRMQSELKEEDSWVVPGAHVYVSCEATDPDGDPVTCQWSATDGQIFGQGTAVIWQAPSVLGMQWITVVAEDIYGATARRSIPITVSAVAPPPLQGLIVSALDTDLFRPYGDSWRIFKERSCAIAARIDDPEGIYIYDWRAERGAIVTDGPAAVWTAPASPKGWVNIVLVVRDRHGNEASDSVRVYVETCTSCM